MGWANSYIQKLYSTKQFYSLPKRLNEGHPPTHSIMLTSTLYTRRKSVPSKSASRCDCSPGITFRVSESVELLSTSGCASRCSDDWEKERPRSFSLTEHCNDSDSDEFPKRRSSLAPVYGGSLAHLVPNQFLQTTSRRVSTHGTATGCSCSSCGSTVTPYWRDGWNPDVMLCNACGLRFQKFARRCPACMYIPRKEDSLGDRCVKCSAYWVIGPSVNASSGGISSASASQ